MHHFTIAASIILLFALASASPFYDGLAKGFEVEAPVAKTCVPKITPLTREKDLIEMMVSSLKMLPVDPKKDKALGALLTALPVLNQLAGNMFSPAFIECALKAGTWKADKWQSVKAMVAIDVQAAVKLAPADTVFYQTLQQIAKLESGSAAQGLKIAEAIRKIASTSKFIPYPDTMLGVYCMNCTVSVGPAFGTGVAIGLYVEKQVAYAQGFYPPDDAYFRMATDIHEYSRDAKSVEFCQCWDGFFWARCLRTRCDLAMNKCVGWSYTSAGTHEKPDSFGCAATSTIPSDFTTVCDFAKVTYTPNMEQCFHIKL